VLKRANRQKKEKHLKKMARRHLRKYGWTLAEIRSGSKLNLNHKEKWILKKAIWAERFLAKHGHQTSNQRT
jgi:hypothetical protein